MTDPCHCGHDLSDHIGPDDACDVPLCACDSFEADGYCPDPDDPSWRDA